MPKMISCEVFEGIKDPNVKLDILFGYIADIYEGQIQKNQNCQKQVEACGNRFKKIEDRKKIDTTFSGLMGIVGGAAIWIFKIIFGK